VLEANDADGRAEPGHDGGRRYSRSTALVRMFFWISLVPP